MPVVETELTLFVSDNTVGTVSFATPEDAASEDGDCAQATNDPSSADFTSEYLMGTELVDKPVGGSTLHYLVIILKRGANRISAGPYSGEVVDSRLHLVKNGVPLTMTNKGDTGNPWPSYLDIVERTFSSAELIALGVSLADLSSTTFGACLSVLKAGGDVIGAQVDRMAIRYSYDGGATPDPVPDTGWLVRDDDPDYLVMI